MADEVGEWVGAVPHRTVIGGFSQGTVMAYAVGLGSGRPRPAGILALSGFVPEVEGWSPTSPRPAACRSSSPTGRGPGDRGRVRPRGAGAARARRARHHLPRAAERPPDRRADDRRSARVARDGGAAAAALRAVRPTLAVGVPPFLGLDPDSMWTCLVSWKASRPSRPSSRPRPDCLKPPNGPASLSVSGSLIQTVPARARACSGPSSPGRAV